ncbi:hypothetical protein Clacol_010384 [Clathrus columnatus]|uniref:Peptidase S59 domain-containing protein n=1 Tax=Clathrus columnatus TaxID=1419009 RepID=A0AAV5AW35_9AGAM|nr:hypothetical protein Clacol_010384 [Clathrus columnatus]
MSSIFGTFGQNNNNNQQQQSQPQQGNAFGQPSAFGGTSDRPDFSSLPLLGFGTFGQNQQQQQQQQPPQVNPMFGNLATPSSSATPGTGGFGAFANPGSNNAFGSRPAFGSTATSTFGQPSAFSGNTGGSVFGSGFGSTNPGSTSAFGQPSQPQQSAFGSTTGNVFGKPAGFGSTALVPTSTSPVPSSGTANPPFQEVQERDPTSVNSNSVLRFQSITAMPEYRNASFEELRVQDYLQGRKVASSTSSFGSTATTSAFGQPSQPSTSLFGQPSTTGNTFGQQQPSTGFGGFGQTQQQQQQPQQSAFGAFGQTQQQSQPAPSTGFGTFGQQTQQQPTSGFGAFGQQTQQPQSTSTFGTFGQQNKTPFSAFGGQATQTPNTFSAFGSNTNSTTSTFGQAPQPQQQQSAFGGFGQNNAQQQSSSFLKPSVFGTQPSTSSVFGTSTNQQQQQPQSSIFGTPAATQQPTQTGLFGNTTATQQSSPFGQPPQPPQQTSVFGSQSSGGLFGTTPQNQQQNQQASTTGGFNSLFSKPAGSSIFGNNTATQPSNTQNLQNPNPNNPLFSGGGGLFGNTNNNNQPTAASSGGSLFGSTSTGTGLWGAKPAPSAPAFGSTGGLFGNTTQGTQQTQPPVLVYSGMPLNSLNSPPEQQPQQQQPTLTASIDQPLPANLPTLPPLAASLNFDKKKSNIFADIALRTSPRLSLHYKPPSPSSKTRSLNASTSRWQIPSNSTPGSSPNKLFPLSQSKSLITPEAFASPGSLQLLNGARQSVKKLILDKHVEKDDILRLRPDAASDANAKIRFNPALEAMARAKDNEPTTVLPAKGHPSNSVFASSAEKTTSAASAKVASTPLDPQEGEYWCLPTVPELQRLSYNELQAVKDFTVGRVGYGTVQFLEPVDLTTVPSIADIPGKIIAFEHMECTLYTDERLRPPPGEGLNVPARIKLDRCWAPDKSTREPIKDPENLKYQQRLRKMQNQEGTEFVNFEKETGVWEFLVQEF